MNNNDKEEMTLILSTIFEQCRKANCNACKYKDLSLAACLSKLQADTLYDMGWRKVFTNISLTDKEDYQLQKSLANFDMALPKDFKTRFNNEITVLSTGKLPKDLRKK